MHHQSIPNIYSLKTNFVKIQIIYPYIQKHKTKKINKSKKIKIN